MTDYPKPPFPAQAQAVPGAQSKMQPYPDCGEQSYVGSGRLAGKIALITGADSGIGRAVAIAFAREGADVVVAYLNEHDDAKETARWVEQISATACSSSRPNTLPIGLCGLLRSRAPPPFSDSRKVSSGVA